MKLFIKNSYYRVVCASFLIKETNTFLKKEQGFSPYCLLQFCWFIVRMFHKINSNDFEAISFKCFDLCLLGNTHRRQILFKHNTIYATVYWVPPPSHNPIFTHTGHCNRCQLNRCSSIFQYITVAVLKSTDHWSPSPSCSTTVPYMEVAFFPVVMRCHSHRHSHCLLPIYIIILCPTVGSGAVCWGSWGIPLLATSCQYVQWPMLASSCLVWLQSLFVGSPVKLFFVGI